MRKTTQNALLNSQPLYPQVVSKNPGGWCKALTGLRPFIKSHSSVVTSVLNVD